jgi:PAS domain S-box-containing protein
MLVISTLIVVIVIQFSYKSGQSREAARDQMEISRKIQQATEDLLSSLKDAETGQRGYLLTGREDYLEPYRSALAAIPVVLGNLREVAAPRPEQAEQVKGLEPVVAAKLRELDLTIGLRRSQGLAAANAVVDTGRGKTLMDDIRDRCAKIREATERRVTEFSAAAERSAGRLAVLSITGSLVLLVFLLLSAIVIFRSLALREKLYRDAAANAELLRVTLTSIGDAVVATDAAAKITFINPVAQQLTGWSAEEAIGNPISQVLHIVNEATRKPVDNPLETALATGAAAALANHSVLIPKRGREIPIDDSGAPIRNHLGDIVGAIIVFRDVSARRSSEVQLKESNELLKDFVDAAAHDLRSPLNSVNAVAQVLTQRYRDALGTEGNELLTYITSGISRMARLLEDLIAYAQASHFEPGDGRHASMDEALRTVLENLRANIENTRAAVMSEPLPPVAAREAHVVQLLQNLIGNALKYHGERPPQISIVAETRNSECIIRVSDNGIGIEPQYIETIFKPFKRLHGDDRPGSGIGLATCQKIVAGYGGQIWVESSPGEGSTFFFTLPAAGEMQPANAAALGGGVGV